MRIRTGLALGLLLALSVAGCGGGGGGDDGVATAGGAQGTPSSSAGAGAANEREQGLLFGKCMRENGVPNFPDPKVNEEGGLDLGAPEGVDRAKVDAAMEKCKAYMPHGGEPAKLDPQRLEQLRKLAQCMRDNGIKNFPDPTDEGIKGDSSDPEQNPDNPKFQAAQKICDKYAPAPPGEGSGNSTQHNGNG